MGHQALVFGARGSGAAVMSQRTGSRAAGALRRVHERASSRSRIRCSDLSSLSVTRDARGEGAWPVRKVSIDPQVNRPDEAGIAPQPRPGSRTRPIVQLRVRRSWPADQLGMPVNFNVGALSRFTPASTVLSRRDPAAPSKVRAQDTADVRSSSAPEPAELTLADARAAVASLRDDMTARPRVATAAQANVRPQDAIVIGR